MRIALLIPPQGQLQPLPPAGGGERKKRTRTRTLIVNDHDAVTVRLVLKPDEDVPIAASHTAMSIRKLVHIGMNVEELALTQVQRPAVEDISQDLGNPREGKVLTVHDHEVAE